MLRNSGHVSLARAVSKMSGRPSVIDITSINPHPGHGGAILRECDSALERHLAEGSVMLIMKVTVWQSVVRHEDVRPPIAVKIGDTHSHALPARIANSRAD